MAQISAPGQIPSNLYLNGGMQTENGGYVEQKKLLV